MAAQLSYGQSSPAPNPGQDAGRVNSSSSQRFVLSGGIENNNGELRLNLSNESSQEFRGTGVIGLGSNMEQKELGQLTFTLPAQETTLFRLTGVQPSGSQFSLKIFNQAGALIFYKIAPIKSVSDGSPAIAVTLSPVGKKGDIFIAPVKSAQIVGPAGSPSTVSSTPASGNPVPGIAEAVIKGRLLANQTDDDQMVLVLEIKSPQPIVDATIDITIGRFRESKPVSGKPDQTVEFKLPDQLDDERVVYVLTAKNGREIARGDLDLGELLSEDVVTVADIKTDKPSYEPGESAHITLMLEGRSPHGHKIELLARDGQGNTIFNEQLTISANTQTDTQQFSMSLPREITTPVVLEFRILDSETGLLFDSGEREIQINDPKRRP